MIDGSTLRFDPGSFSVKASLVVSSGSEAEMAIPAVEASVPIAAVLVAAGSLMMVAAGDQDALLMLDAFASAAAGGSDLCPCPWVARQRYLYEPERHPVGGAAGDRNGQKNSSASWVTRRERAWSPCIHSW